MNRTLLNCLGLLTAGGMMLAPTRVLAANAEPVSWHAQSLGQAVLYMLLFAVVGIVMVIIGYKIFDVFTPGNLSREIFENRNVAAAIVTAAVILGLCIIVAAAMIG